MKNFWVLLILAAVFMSGCGAEKVERAEKFMGTVLSLKAEGVDADAAVAESFAAVAALQENILADAKKIEAAAGNGDFVKINRDVFEILKIAQDFSAVSDGAFDVTIGAAVDLWKPKEIPAAAEIAAVKSLVNYKNLELRESDCAARLKIAGMKINLGGIAKGYAVDAVRKIFAAHNVQDGLIDFGNSSIYAINTKRIGLKNPRAAGELAQVVEVADSAISTSGDYEKFFIADGRRYSHILNPKTCAPVETKIAAVTVIVDGEIENCATLADILSTTVFVLGKERAEEILANVRLPKPVQIAVFIDD